MSDVDLKNKYLRRAHHLSGGNTKRRLQASVGPLSDIMRAKPSTVWSSGGSSEQNDSDIYSQRRTSSQHLHSQTSPTIEVNNISPTLSPNIQQSHPITSSSLPTLHQSHGHSLSLPRQKISVDTSDLENQLRTQTDVNKELKRLLIASVGRDLELRLEQIAREKAELSQDLDLSLQQVMSNYEELDQVSIECDIWRTKFIASRVMIDELASWKAELSLQFRECRRALQYMMQERGEIVQALVDCNAHLQLAHKELHGLIETHSNTVYSTSSTSSNVATVSPVQYASSSGLRPGVRVTAVDLAHSNTLDARNLTPQLHRMSTRLPNVFIKSRSVPIMTPHLNMEPTAGERLAQRVMKLRTTGQRNRESSPPLPKLLLTDEDLIHHHHRSNTATDNMMGSSLPPLSRRLFHFGAKALEDPFRIPFHCSKCSGKIIIV